MIEVVYDYERLTTMKRSEVSTTMAENIEKRGKIESASLVKGKYSIISSVFRQIRLYNIKIVYEYT